MYRLSSSQNMVCVSGFWKVEVRRDILLNSYADWIASKDTATMNTHPGVLGGELERGMTVWRGFQCTRTQEAVPELAVKTAECLAAKMVTYFRQSTIGLEPTRMALELLQVSVPEVWAGRASGGDAVQGGSRGVEVLRCAEDDRDFGG